MLRQRLQKAKEQGGFTIIEVLIVLAIAGLIIAIVLVAIPQLQRNQRNEARRNVINRIKTEVESYAGNNSGSYPTANNNATTGFNTGGGFPTRYLSGVNTNDPKTGAAMLMATWTADNALVEGTISYVSNRLCSGETSTATGASARNYVMMTLLEGGAIYCVDNR